MLGRPLPGTAHAVRQLRFHIERDADRSAVRERADRLALASAICKAATGATTRAGMAALGGDGTAARVRELLQDAVPGGGARRLRALAVAVADARGGRRAVAAVGRQRARRSGRALRRVVAARVGAPRALLPHRGEGVGRPGLRVALMLRDLSGWVVGTVKRDKSPDDRVRDAR